MNIRNVVRQIKSACLPREFHALDYRVRDLEERLRRVQEALGRVEGRQLGHTSPRDGLAAHEYRVFSQWGEDGIIQHLVREVPVDRTVFVEFGVESYEEANTRFLLVNNGWSGLVIDADAEQVARLRRSPVYWRHNLKAVSALITRENINTILTEQGVTGPIGLLSIDIDGMDYWIWEAIDVIEPAIVVIEYNHRFGPDATVTVPYDASFDRRRAHPSIIYYGASLSALAHLGRRKGYALVGVGTAGLNAFFVQRDRLPASLPELSTREAFRRGSFCETHDEHGRRIRTDWEEERALVSSLPLVNVNGVEH